MGCHTRPLDLDFISYHTIPYYTVPGQTAFRACMVVRNSSIHNTTSTFQAGEGGDSERKEWEVRVRGKSGRKD